MGGPSKISRITPSPSLILALGAGDRIIGFSESWPLPATVRVVGEGKLCYKMVMSELASGTLAAGIWDRVINADDEALSADEARAVLRWKFSASDRQRVEDLSEKARAGQLTVSEERELDEYLAIESALISLKSKARRTLESTRLS